MKPTLFALIALVAGVAAGYAISHREFAHEVMPVDMRGTPASASTPARAKIGPKLVVVNGENHNFGTMDRNAHGKHAFLVRNDGDAPLTLATGQPSCGVCIKVFSVAKERLEPGEQTEVTIEWDVKTGDTEFEQSGPLTTNDPQRETVTLYIRGHILDPVRIDRTDVHFHDLLQTDSATANVLIHALKDPELKVEKHEFSNPSLEKFFSASFVPMSPDEVSREPNAKGGLKMQIEVKPGLPYGDFRESYTITTNQSPDPLTVRLIGNIASDILLMGPGVLREKSAVNLGAITRSQGKKHTIFLIVKGPHRDNTKVEIASYQPTHEFSAMLGEPIRDSEKTIRYPIMIDVPAGATPVTRMEGTHATIKIATTHPDVKDVELKVRYIVKE
jgi:hypothetical protein